MLNKFIKELSGVISKIDNPKLAQDFLETFLTPAELEEVAKRLQIVKLLSQGVSQRDVSAKLNVSIGTVSRGSREVKYGKPGLKDILSWQ